MLEDTRQQMTVMQENFIAIESEWKEEKIRLLHDLENRDEKIKNLEEANKILDDSRFEISVTLAKVNEELNEKNNEILSLQNKLSDLLKLSESYSNPITPEDSVQEKGSIEIANMMELTKRIALLEQLNFQIRQTNKELESKLSNLNTDLKPSVASSPKKNSPLPTRKGGRNTASRAKSPWSNIAESSSQPEPDKKSGKIDTAKTEMLLQSLNKDIIEKEYLISQLQELVSEKDAIIQSLNITITEKDSCIQSLNEEIKNTNIAPTKSSKETENEEDLTEINKRLEIQLQTAQDQIVILNDEIDAANKNMIKVKSGQKLKLKQMQKTIDNFSKMSDANSEITKLNDEVNQLTQKVAELEEEKGNLQLHLVDYDGGRLTESETYKKLVEMESLAESRLNAISILETQKLDLVQELHSLQQKNVEMEDTLADLSHLQNEQVCSEMQNLQLEEQLDKLVADKKVVQLVLDKLELDKERLNNNLKRLEEQNIELTQKLDIYIQENIELTDKLEKLSAEKVSSAESIEIVESLTTQEKMELEEYNKGVVSDNNDILNVDDNEKKTQHDLNESVQKLTEESAELNKKIELFTLERQEVMDKMSILNSENESLHKQILILNSESSKLRHDIDLLNTEKQHFETLNTDLYNQIEELKREQVEVIKEASISNKPVGHIDETSDLSVLDVLPDDRSSVEKAGKGSKSIKQLTKDILKLKNVIKDRGDEIADCHMKILALEEQQQKQSDIIQTNEVKLKSLDDEKNLLITELNALKEDKNNESSVLKELTDSKYTNETLHLELGNIHREYTATIALRDSKILELENLLSDYEKQIHSYNNTLKIKDKQLTDYANQITKLNEVSQKLKSTIECLEEEKAKDQNAELVKSLNKQISIFKKSLSEYEDKLNHLEEDKSKIVSVKSTLEIKCSDLDNELLTLKQLLSEKEVVMSELLVQKQTFSDEISAITSQVKERDEEIHEMKLQLRKESIENEKLRTELLEKEKHFETENQNLNELNLKIDQLVTQKNDINEKNIELESKNIELLEKCKKYLSIFKKKQVMYTDLEHRFNEVQKQHDITVDDLQTALGKVEEMSNMQEKFSILQEELKNMQSLSESQHEKQAALTQLQEENKNLLLQIELANSEINKLTEKNNFLKDELLKCSEENSSYKVQVESFNNKVIALEIEQKNNINLITKINTLEEDIREKEANITDLSDKVVLMEQNCSKLQFGYDAKIQERAAYIESLETEITKYENRIGRLEETICDMEDRRHSLERKADQLDSQLQDKHKAYDEYTHQEDELIKRLAVLMDHDRVVEKQLHEIENDNKELQFKIHTVNEDNIRLRQIISDIQRQHDDLLERATKASNYETQVNNSNQHIQELENHIRKISIEHQTILSKRKQDIEELESEFNTQIENAIIEKRTLSEKYEKVKEHVDHLEHKVNEYKSSINNLHVNIDELTKYNNSLLETSKDKEAASLKDYTEQYINEINKLNAVINEKNKEISELSDNIRQIQGNSNNVILSKQLELDDLSRKLNNSSVQINTLSDEMSHMKHNIDLLKIDISEKENQIRNLIEKKSTMSFEMNIPKTEGLVISSTIQELSEQPNIHPPDIAIIESQIIANVPDSAVKKLESKHPKASKDTVHNVAIAATSETYVEEPLIEPKNAYLCYKNTEPLGGEHDNTGDITSRDPFNSDEGWGFDDNLTASNDMIDDFSRLNEQILQLKKEKELLNSELETSNLKMLKVCKKLKEFKANNEMLNNELRLSKHLSQSSFLDNAIEDEMRLKIQDLDKQIEELQTKLNSEKRENDSLRKQNEVLGAGNDRLTEIKEKLDNEVELWKFKFKEVNDKMSSAQWGSEPKPQANRSSEKKGKEEVSILETENDDLHNQIYELTKQNNDFVLTLSRLKEELNFLKEKQKSCENCKILQDRILKLECDSEEITKEIGILEGNIENLLSEKRNYEEIIQNYLTQINSLNVMCNAQKSQLELSTSELITVKSDLANLEHKYKAAHEQILENQSRESHSLDKQSDDLRAQYDYLKTELDESNVKRASLENYMEEILKKLKVYENESIEMNQTIKKLNNENDKLLSSVTELRSSVSGAVDQRGYEISEMWKEHLAQREADFVRVEQELREQLGSSERKYEQLLDNMQSSSQEETNKMVMLEQCNTLQNKLKDKEDHMIKLQSKYSDILSQLELLRSEMEDERLMHENKILSQQEEYENTISNLKAMHHQNIISENEQVRNLQNELVLLKEDNSLKAKEIDILTAQIKSFDTKIYDMTNELKAKDSEIYKVTQNFTLALSERNDEFDNVRKQLISNEKKLEEMQYEKDSDLAILRLKMHENMTYYEDKIKEYENEKVNVVETLNAKVTECLNVNKEIMDLNSDIEEKSNKIAEMQTIMENQEYEIVGLKENVEELERLLKESGNKIEKRVTFASDTKPGSEDGLSKESILNKELLESDPNAELDLALYMLHQRDVRCEELTMELSHLLEERDTLQLRLSDSLRTFEDLKVKCNAAGYDISFPTPQEMVSGAPVITSDKSLPIADVHRSSRSSSVSEETEKQLQAK